MEEIYERAMLMIRSRDVELIRLGALLMLSYVPDMNTLERFIPDGILSNLYQADRIPVNTEYVLSHLINGRHQEEVENEFIIKNGKCIGILNGYVICRSLNLLKLHRKYSQYKKTYYD